MSYEWQRRLSNRQRRVLARARGRAAREPKSTQLRLETLEQIIVPSCDATAPFRTITGACNNLANPDWGKGNIDLLRKSPVAYADHISSPSTPNALSPRQISNDLSNQSNPIFLFGDNLGNPNSRQLSDYAYAFGQFIDHDMDLTLDSSGQAFDIPPDPTRSNDPLGTEPFTRSQFNLNSGTSRSNPRQQINLNTSFLDLSQVYGSTDAVSSLLRSHVGGRMRTSAGDFLPRERDFTAAQLAVINRDEGGIANDAHQVLDSELFVAGDKRVNEVIELTAQQTLFMRNHNRLADQIHAAFPSLSDERVFQEARKLNIAEYQNIVYNGYLPSILGTSAIPAYTGYNPNLNPGIRTEFSTVGFRFGHSLLSSTVGRDNNDGTGINDVNPNGSPVNLTEDFFRPDMLNNNHVTVNLVDRFGHTDLHTSSTVGELLKALADGLPNEFDLRLIDEVRNILFGIPHGPGTDLAARDIQRTRDHGIGTYNQVRVAYGLAPVTAFNQISSDTGVQSALQGIYSSVNAIDPFIGMLAEDIIPGSDVGPTCRAILVHQFVHLRDGDRFFFLNEGFNSFEQALLSQGDDYADVISNNTSITNLQSDVFFNRLEISGTVFSDPDGNGVRESSEPGIQGVTVELHDAATGAMIASTVTDTNGEYDFTELGAGTDGTVPATGNYTLRVILPSGFSQNATQVAHNPGEVFLSRGDLQIDGQDFALTPSAAPGGGPGLAVGLGAVQSFQSSTTQAVNQTTPTQATMEPSAARATSDSATGTSMQSATIDDGNVVATQPSSVTEGVNLESPSLLLGLDAILANL